MSRAALEPVVGLPVVCELLPAPQPEEVFRALCELPHCVFLDSALVHARLGRYSFIAADPWRFEQRAVGDGSVWHELPASLQLLTSNLIGELPPFQGGAAGLFAYELGRSIETLPAARLDEFGVPALALGWYDLVVAFDHIPQRAWIISQGWPASGAARHRRAEARMRQWRERIQQRTRPADRAAAGQAGTVPPRNLPALSPHFEVPGHGQLFSNFTADGYLRAIERAIEYIRAGDIFQVNLAQRLVHPARACAWQSYLDLRQRNPAPFGGYFDLGEFQVLSASPERFLEVHDRQVETRPIKGTRPRRRHAEADLFAGDELRQSEKDRAENVMIVDLMRNDLSRVCEPESVQVTQLCQVESYQYVQHLVSAITGVLVPEASSVDLLRAAFPGGSITGAPKIRAMEIIAELEPHARGAYCGSLGYLNWNGSLDLSILIRTITAGKGWWQFPVGGGIVAQSDPRREYEETWHKAEGLLRGRDTAASR